MCFVYIIYMKIRNGFVSNSSSSSFVILGVYVGDEETTDFVDAFLNIPSIKEDFEKENEVVESYSEDREQLNEDFLWWFESVYLDKYDLDVVHAEDGFYSGYLFSRLDESEESMSLKDLNKIAETVTDVLSPLKNLEINLYAVNEYC